MSRSRAERTRVRLHWRERVLPQWSWLVKSVLTRNEAIVLDLRLCLTTTEPIPHWRIARRLDCSSSHVATLERAALQKVAAALKLEEPDDTP